MSEWISVKDRLPTAPIDKRGYVCKCCIKGYEENPFFMVLNYYLCDRNPHFQHEDNKFCVTHWTSLPKGDGNE